jgi:hypothetical protein
MAIEGIRIRTPDFALRADRIAGRQLWHALDSLGGARGVAGTPTVPEPGATRSPAAEFRRLLQCGGANSDGFASGGAPTLQHLNPNTLLDLLMRLLRQLIESLLQMLGNGAANSSGNGTGSSNSTCGNTTPGGPAPGNPTTGTPTTGNTANGVPTTGAPVTGTPTKPGCSTPVSEAACPPRPRCRPRRRGGGLRRILAKASSIALTAGSSLVPYAGIAGTIGRLASSSSGLVRGGSLEDQIAQFFRSRVREVEDELKKAMHYAQQVGDQSNGTGESRSSASTQVQVLVQKRAEMLQMLTDTLRTMHESAMAVNRNLK